MKNILIATILLTSMVSCNVEIKEKTDNVSENIDSILIITDTTNMDTVHNNTFEIIFDSTITEADTLN